MAQGSALQARSQLMACLLLSVQAVFEAITCCALDAVPTCRCTAVTAVVVGDRLLVANVGDSRAVLCRQGKGVLLRRLKNVVEHMRYIKQLHNKQCV
jgi:serine/threonine protein phosphatase PrpC